MNCLTASREPACWRCTAPRFEREDAARWAHAFQAVLDLSLPQHRETQQDMKDTWQIGGHAPGLTDLEGPLEPRRRLGELAVEHAGKCNQPRAHGLEGLIKRWRGAEPEVIVLRSKVYKGTPSPPPGWPRAARRVVSRMVPVYGSMTPKMS